MPIIGSAQQREQSKLLNKVLEKMLNMQIVFQYFVDKGWTYQSVTIDHVLATMTDQDKRDFPIDIRGMDWDRCLTLFSYGIRRFFIKEDTVAPYSFEQLLCKNQIELAHDIKTAYRAKVSGFKTNVGYFKELLLPHKYTDFLLRNKTDQ